MLRRHRLMGAEDFADGGPAAVAILERVPAVEVSD